MFLKHLQWRKANGIDTILQDFVFQVGRGVGGVAPLWGGSAQLFPGWAGLGRQLIQCRALRKGLL